MIDDKPQPGIYYGYRWVGDDTRNRVAFVTCRKCFEPITHGWGLAWSSLWNWPEDVQMMSVFVEEKWFFIDSPQTCLKHPS